ncbi:MAG: leucyl aminopeptidase [Candidatus Omnitrophota bacterium]|jgi:leucyl aminopeptidase
MNFGILTAEKKRDKADLLIAGVFEKEPLLKDLGALEPAFAGLVKAASEKKRFDAKFAKAFSSFQPEYREAPEALVLGLGERKNYKKICFRKAAGEIVKHARARKAARVRVIMDTFLGADVDAACAAELLSAIGLLASYAFDKYKAPKKEGEEPIFKIETVEMLFVKKQRSELLKERIQKSSAVAAGVEMARNLINEPANVMTPPAMAEAARAMAASKKISCTLLGERELKELKMGGVLAVNQGSVHAPRFVVLEYGTRFKKKGTVCLVGKGVTFDTGGISIKPAKDMEKMKYDMSGAAAVIAAVGVAADLKLPVHVVGLTPLVENNVAANPQRPGDIIRMANGKTVEVINTDAEGRLILGDALHYAGKFNPKVIVDLATLTGMCAYTFGDKAIGLLGSDARLIERIKKAGEASGERCWQLPLWEDYAEQIKGHQADLLNTGGPYGGTITAAMFLKQFVPEKTPWAHLDIAGTAWAEKDRFDCPRGAAGVGVRLLTEFLIAWK